MRRKRMSRRYSRKAFRAGATYVNPRNQDANPLRGGYRL